MCLFISLLVYPRALEVACVSACICVLMYLLNSIYVNVLVSVWICASLRSKVCVYNDKTCFQIAL